MSNTKHTPGPWKIIEVISDTASGPTPYPRAIAGSVTVAELPERSPLCMMEEREANARLIAAAPELLAAALRVQSFMDDYVKEGYESAMRRDLRAAIAKAK